MKPKSGPTKKGHLSEDEHGLWVHTASTVAPLKRKKGRVIPAAEALSGDGAGRRPSAGEKPAPAADAQSHRVMPVKPAAAKKAPPLAEFDRKKERRIRSGRTEIEARIDLHGMTLDEALPALRSFLHRAAGQGRRTVLVITGKGAPARRAADTPLDDVIAHRPRGVLRRHVPMWLAEPELRALVVSFTTAAPQHGGEGAIYVHLRNMKR
jgi:DNA-nicking Smr family endonuclease